MSNKKLTEAMQVAAVLVALDEGKTLDQVESDFPELSAGVSVQRARLAAQKPEGSGPTSRLPSARKSFTA